MALLTADDVHWKQFLVTKFREGYDQVEVDEFLDQVVETIATLTTENASLKTQLDEVRVAAANGEPIPTPEANNEELENLRAQLAEANTKVEQLQNQTVVVSDGQADEKLTELQQALTAAEQAKAEAEMAAEQARNEAAQLRGELEQARAATPAAAAPSGAEDAASMLALAQRVHDEYVRNGQEEADQIVSNARGEGDKIVKEANDERDRVIAKLEDERNDLQAKVDELKTFEAEYCSQLREHLTGLLSQLGEGQ